MPGEVALEPRTSALLAAANLASVRGDLDRAAALGREALAVARGHDDFIAARALDGLGVVEERRGRSSGRPRCTRRGWRSSWVLATPRRSRGCGRT